MTQKTQNKSMSIKTEGALIEANMFIKTKLLIFAINIIMLLRQQLPHFINFMIIMY